MCIENSNSAMHVLVLARPADSLCALLAAALGQWRYEFSAYSTVYEVLNAAKQSPVDLPVILIVRPLMLGISAALYIKRHFPNLQMIGWLDPDENMSGCTITQMTVNGMVLVSRLDQLQTAIDALNKTIIQSESIVETSAIPFPDESDRLACVLSDDEVNALLGVE